MRRLLYALPLVSLACAASAPPPPPPKCPTIAPVAPPVATTPATATPYDAPDLACFVEMPGHHTPTPGCLVGLPIDDGVAARLAALPNHDRWEIHLLQANDDDLKSVARIPWARSLVLEAPKLTNLDALASLPSLLSLSIEKGSVGSMAALASHPAIRSIELIDVDTPTKTLTDVVPLALVGIHVDGLVQLEDVSVLGTIASLKIVDLERLPALKDVSPLAKIEGLEDLHLVDLPIADVPFAPSWASSLFELHVEGDPNVKSFGFLSKLADLRVLHLNQTTIDSLAPLSKLTHLEVVQLEKTKVGDLGPLASVKSLRLVLVDDAIAQGKRDALAKSLPHTEIRNRPEPTTTTVISSISATGCETFCAPGNCLCDPKPVPCPTK